MQLKLDELIRSTQTARNSLIDIEELSDEQLRTLQESFRRLAERNAESAKDLLKEVEEELEERDDSGRDEQPGNGRN